MQTDIICFPFDLFGSSGTSTGALLLADALRELLADNKREKMPTRARAYAGKVRLSELVLDTVADYQNWRKRAHTIIASSWKERSFLMWITGNHLGALPVYDLLAHDARDVLVVQFDAHLDIYNLTDCTRELSHGNFLLHVEGKLPPLVNVGHRELLLRPEYIAKYYRKTFSAAELATAPETAVGHLRQACRRARRVVIDLDCDVFDAGSFPASAHPVPFGLSHSLVLRLLDAVWSERVVAFLVSEFAPARDRDDHCLAMLMWLLEYVLLKRYEV